MATTTYLLNRDASPPLSYLYPSRVIEGTRDKTILKLTYVDFFRTGGMIRQASEMENVAPGKENELFEKLIEDAIASTREKKLIVKGDVTHRIFEVSLTTLRGDRVDPIMIYSGELSERLESHLIRSLITASRMDPNVKEAILYVTTPVEGGNPTIYYQMDTIFNTPVKNRGYSKFLYSGFLVRLPGEEKPTLQTQGINILSSAIERASKSLRKEIPSSIKPSSTPIPTPAPTPARPPLPPPASTHILHRDTSPPLSYLYPSRVIEGTPGETILKLMYVDFFRTAGMTAQATEMEGVAPGGEHELFGTLLETAITSSRGGKLVVGGDDALALPGMILTTLQGEGVSPSERPPAEFFERFQKHLEKALQIAARSDPDVREAIRYVTTPVDVDGKPPRIIYRMDETLTDLNDRQGYSKSLYTAFRIQLPSDEKPKTQARKPDIVTDALVSVSQKLREEPVGVPTTGAEAESVKESVLRSPKSLASLKEGAVETPFIEAIRRDLHLDVNEDGSVTQLTSLGTPPMTYLEWLEILKMAVQTSRGALLSQFPSMILPTLANDGVVKTAEMLGEIIGSRRDPQRQADLQVFREEAPDEEVKGKEGALAPQEEVPDVIDPFNTQSYIPLKGVHIPLMIV